MTLKNCAPFRKCILHINDEYVEKADILDVVMPMYNLIEYSDNYSESSASLYQFKREEPPSNNNTFGNAAVGAFNYKYKFDLEGNRVKILI